jgi:ABC-type transport system substrate-binding protein
MIDPVGQDLHDKPTWGKKHGKSNAYVSVALVVLLTAVSCTAAAPAATPAPPTPNVPTGTPTSPTKGGPWSYVLPTEDGAWTPPASHAGEMPAGTGTVSIKDVGEFTFDASQVETLRPDIFQRGHFSLFDILVHLDKQGDIQLDYHPTIRVDGPKETSSVWTCIPTRTAPRFGCLGKVRNT